MKASTAVKFAVFCAVMIGFQCASQGAGELVVVEQPVSQIAEVGSAVTFLAKVTGAYPLRYSWWHQGLEIPGTDQPRLFRRAVTPSDAGVYQMRVRNSLGEAWSEAVVLDVREPEVVSKSGTVLFANRVSPSIVAPIYDSDGRTLLSGPAFFAQLYGGPSADGLQPVGPAVPFRVGDGAGFWDPAPDAVRFIPSVKPGDTAWVQVRVWDAVTGKYGHSEVLRVQTGGGQPPVPPGPLVGLVSFSLGPEGPPTIRRQPAPVSVEVGWAVTLEVIASGSALRYQWYLNDQPIAGATSAAYQIGSATVRDSGTYSVVVSNGAGSVRSASAKVTVTQRVVTLKLAEQPVSQIAESGSAVTFTAKVNGLGPFRYSWWHQGVEIPGTDQPRLFLPAVTPSDAGVYQMRVRNSYGVGWSEAVVLDVREPEVVSTSGTVLFVNRLTPSIVAPIYDRDGWTRLSGPAYFAQLYGGPSADSLQPAGPAVPFRVGDGAGFWNPAPDAVRYIPSVAPGATAWVQVKVWEAVAGPTYEAAVLAGGGFGRSAVLQVSTGGGQPPAPPSPLLGLMTFSLFPETPPSIEEQPASVSVGVGGVVTLRVRASGSALQYQWYLDDQPIVGATTPRLELGPWAEGDSGTCYVVVSNGAGSVRSAPVSVKATVDRVLEFKEASPVMEGAKGSRRLWIHGNQVVSRGKLWVRYDPTVLTDFRVRWSSMLTNAVRSVNLNMPGWVEMDFTLPGAARPDGETLEIADLDFRARSVDELTTSALEVQIGEILGVEGESLRVGTVTRPAIVQLNPNPLPGDVNGNGRLDVGDAAVVLRWGTRGNEARPWDVRDNDLDGNGVLDARDAERILASGWPAENTGGVGDGTPAAPATALQSAGSARLWIDPWIWPTVATPDADVRLTVRVAGLDQGIRGVRLKIQYPTEALRPWESNAIAFGGCLPTPPDLKWVILPENLSAAQDGMVRLAFAAATNRAVVDSCEVVEFNFKVQPGVFGLREFEIKVEAQDATLNGYDLEAVRAGSRGFIVLGSSGTDPTAARPILGLPRRRLEGGWKVPVVGDPGRRYIILQSSDLVGWSLGGQLTIPGNGEAEVVDEPGTNRVRIFRLVEAQ